METLQHLFSDGMPNLDDESNDALRLIVRAGADGLVSLVRSHALDQAAPDDGAFTVAQDLCKYAALILDARAERAIGQIQCARLWERQAQRLYEDLPHWARW